MRNTSARYRRIGFLGLLASVLLVALLSSAHHASAATFGGHWTVAPGKAVVINYNDTDCADKSYRGIIEQAASLWNATVSPADFVHSSSSDKSTVQLFICTGFDARDGGDYWGVTHLYDATG